MSGRGREDDAGHEANQRGDGGEREVGLGEVHDADAGADDDSRHPEGECGPSADRAARPHFDVQCRSPDSKGQCDPTDLPPGRPTRAK